MRASPPRRPGGFTLIEIIVGLTIIALIVGIAIPTIGGLQDERRARAPLRALSDLVQEVRQHAVRDRRPYQITFDATGFHAAPFVNAYGSRGEFVQWLDEIQRPPDQSAIQRQEIGRTEIVRENQFEGLFTDGEPPGWTPPFVRSYPLPEGVGCELRFWGDYAAAAVPAGALRRWIFQPTGLVTPLEVSFSRGDAFFEAEFDVLTGEIVRERSSVTPRPRGAQPEGGNG